MSQQELRRVEVRTRYREKGRASLPQCRVHLESCLCAEVSTAVLDLVRKKYGGPLGERFGPTLAAEHLEAEDGLVMKAETLRQGDSRCI